MLPSSERILLGPGPSLISPRVTRALGAPMLSHLDPQFVGIMDDVRERLARVFKAPPGSFAFAVSGTGTSGMETAVANLVQPGTRVLSLVTGYFAMGASSTPALVALFLDAIADALHAQRVALSPAAGSAAALATLGE